MTRLLREWALPLAVAVPIGIGAAWALSHLSLPWAALGWFALVVMPTVAIWILSEGTLASIASWLVPALLLAAAVILMPTPVGVIVLTLVLVLPLAGGVIRPLGRAHAWYNDLVAGWLLTHSLPKAEQATYRQIVGALRSDAVTRADSLQTDDLARCIRAHRAQSARILAVEAPDLGWARVIRLLASPTAMYADMLGGRAALDYEAVHDAVTIGREALQALLRSRSLAYRLLSLRLKQAPKAFGN